ncbi:MAG: pantoate--beta-alanine ligase [Flavobacteriaceae bacterium]|jgi:pantoate--beta-alanine ligase|nr:pantoate--beta-alanine ligase [Flavobacteriaceae bacterium]MDG1027595.1 pantoate--beta-alanine ligase [Flavobacteriaceae bacterium]MDG1942069.1 pantoate--beta-alanine ligase [Flavobacteriaceae bacterium]
MKVFKTSQSLVEYLSIETRPLGMVPTMGALHLGHLSLIERAVEENQSVLTSIFVNPTQFNDKNDLVNYPTSIDEDLLQIEKISKKILVYIPEVDDIYGNIVESKSFDLAGLDQVMEGEKRSGHFQGVATVVTHFLKTFTPDRAYFGEKDFQQLLIIDHINRSLKLKTKIIGCPIVREKDGLAMSSRNRMLTPDQRNQASKLFEALQMVKSNAKKVPYRSLKTSVNAFFEKQDEITLDYFMITDPNTLKEIHLEQPVDQGRGFIAAYLGKIRLIDNLDMS